MKASDRQVAGTHYKRMGVQPWDVVDTWPIEQRIGYYRGGALKYLMRMGSKDESPQEISKGIHYMEKLLEILKDDEASRIAVVANSDKARQEDAWCEGVTHTKTATPR